MTDTERDVASFVANLTVDDLPASVREEAGTLTADTLAAIIGGTTLEPVETLAATVSNRTEGRARVLGTPHRSSLDKSVFVAGVGGSVLELNAGHKYAAGHPVIQLLPAVFLEATTNGADGRDYLAALVAGYEVSTRAARASQPLEDAYLPHGVWGVVGAAAGIARLRNLDEDRVLDAMRIAASFAQHTRFESTSQGATGVRNGSCGMSNTNGMVAVDLAETGFTGIEGGIEKHLGMTTASAFDTTVLGEELGEHWEITRGYYKKHAAGRLSHPAIDALERSERDYEFDLTDVESITVDTFQSAARWDGTDVPQNRLHAKSSIPFALATRLVNGSSGWKAFELDAASDDVATLMQSIDVRVDERMDDAVPEARGAAVSVKLASGRVVETEVTHARGGEERPYTAAELQEKFTELVEPIVGETQSTHLWETARSLPDADLEFLGDLCCP